MITWENAVHVPETNIMRVQCAMERNRVCLCDIFNLHEGYFGCRYTLY